MFRRIIVAVPGACNRCSCYQSRLNRSLSVTAQLCDNPLSDNALERAVQTSQKPLYFPTIPDASRQRPRSTWGVITALSPMLAYKMVCDWSFDATDFEKGVRQAFTTVHQAIDSNQVSTIKNMVSEPVYARLTAMAEIQSNMPKGSKLAVENIASIYLLRSKFDVLDGARLFCIDVEFRAQETHLVVDGDGKPLHSRMQQPFDVVRAWRFAKQLGPSDPWIVAGLL
eukprot:TRINITY_DN5583_c0_g2_i1.p1 TRINITY_DN5583_c0_g2~~TRINITY_DN5583_c0_g2_i1.p1  ORF type:complete len:226 (+),score=11.10 TRINITY_DN5583_c0_g2_i1:168-845(+)